MDGSRGSPVGTGLGGFGTVGSGSVGTGQGLVGNGKGLVGTGSGMVITGIGMAGTGIGTESGDAGGSVGKGMGGQFLSGSQTLAGATDPKILLTQQHKASGGYVGRVSVKPPVFYRSNPGVWFRQMESQFVFAGIANDETKFHHILAAFPEDVAINLPMGIDNYRDIKEHICGIFRKSKQEMIEEAPGNDFIGRPKTFIVLMRIQRMLAECNLTLDDDVIKHRLMQAMSISVKTALSAHLELPVEQFAKLADTIYSYSNTLLPHLLQTYSQPQHNRCQQDRCTISIQQKATNLLITQSLTDQSRIHIGFSQQVKSQRDVVFISILLKKQIHVNLGVSGQDKSPKTSSQRLDQNLQQISQTSDPLFVCDNLWGKYLLSHSRGIRRQFYGFHSRHWFND